mmetsp:Transcript_61279/g.138689  ORF Transcript_61279/g.138689 Transcript_61279/m.138689 type:complete len:246 (-) Transcript_61279:225-962(-)
MRLVMESCGKKTSFQFESSASCSWAVMICSSCSSACSAVGLSCVSTPRAASTCDRDTSHRGDSGTAGRQAMRRAAGRAPSRNMARQPSVTPKSARPEPYPRRMPALVDTSQSATSPPRRFGGTSSAVYRGATTSATPTPTPMMTRPPIKSAKPWQAASAAEPRRKRKLATASDNLRPRRSAIGPARTPPMAAARLRIPIDTSSSAMLNRRSGPMVNMAAAITPWSYPERTLEVADTSTALKMFHW